MFLPVSAEGGPGKWRELAAKANADADEGGARFSPDGRLVAFVSNETGRPEVYVAPYQKDGPLGPHRRVSKGPAPSTARVAFYSTTRLAWAGDSRALFYGAAVDKIMKVNIETTPTPGGSTPRVAYDLRQLRVAGDVGSQWDILPDGRLIAIQKGEGEQDVSAFSVVLDWIDEVRRRLPQR
jgi:Tol biopolymer transport system component